MIIYTQAFLLAAAAAGAPLTRARIGYQTYTQDAVPDDVTASGDSTEYPKDAPLRPETWEFWRPPALPATWVLEFNATRAIDYVGIVHNLASCAASVLVETQLGAGAWVTFATDTAPGDNTPLLFLGESTSCSRIRLTITGGSIMPSISVVYVGEALAMERAVSGPYRPINMARETVLQASMSRGGHYLGQDYRRNSVAGQISFSKLSAAWIRSDFEPFAKAARKRPYFLAWNPGEFPLEVGYVWTEDDIVPEYENIVDNMRVSWQARGIGAT